MQFTKLYKILSDIIKSGNNPFDVDYWTPVYFHPYVTLVEGEWISSVNVAFELEYQSFAEKIDNLGTMDEFFDFMQNIKSKVTKIGYIVPPNIYKDKPIIRHCWDNKVAVSLLGKNEEILFLGWADHNLCIGTELMSDYLTKKVVSYSVNNSN
jgi:hypothetical protein